MKNLPKNIKIRFYNILLEKQSVLDFEKWVYESKELEKSIDENSYLAFISLSYKSNGAYYELKKLIEKEIDNVDFLKWKLITELNNVKERKGNYQLSIVNFYDLYCKGYNFMENLAFGYGLKLDCPFDNCGVESFDELSQSQSKTIIDGFYPEIISEIDQILVWLNNNEIILKENNTEFGLLEYDDLRKKENSKSTTYPVVKGKDDCRKWWKFWQQKA